MTSTGGPDTVEQRAAELRREQQQRLSRFFVTIAVAEGIMLFAAVLVVYVLELIDPSFGVWLLVGVALLGGSLMSLGVLSHQARARRETEEFERRYGRA